MWPRKRRTPSRMIPKAMRMTIYIGGAAATWVCLAFVLSIPDIGAVMSGKDKDPIVTLLRCGHGRGRFSRRHRGGAGVLHLLPAELAGRRQPPDVRLRARSDDLRQQVLEPHVAGPPCSGHGADRDRARFRRVIALSALWLQDAITIIISFAAVGIYISFQMIVLAALIARCKGWRPQGPFSPGRLGLAA